MRWRRRRFMECVARMLIADLVVLTGGVRPKKLNAEEFVLSGSPRPPRRPRGQGYLLIALQRTACAAPPGSPVLQSIRTHAQRRMMRSMVLIRYAAHVRA
jgi:hypothetical protein